MSNLILSQAKHKEVSPQEVRDKLNPANGFTLLEHHEGNKWEQGHLDKAVFFFPVGSLSKSRQNAPQSSNQYSLSRGCPVSTKTLRVLATRM